MTWSTRFTKKFPARLPIMGAPMANHVSALMAYEVCRAGGLGLLAAGHLQEVTSIEKDIEEFRKDDIHPLSIGFICFSTFGSPEGWKRFEFILDKHRPAVVQFFAPAVVAHDKQKAMTNIKMAHKYNAKVLCQVGSIKEARMALDAGADSIIVQGSEAGGHGLRRELGNGTLPFASTAVSIVRSEYDPDTPVLAAGGIMDGRSLVAALALGCDGVVLGTRLWATSESKGQASVKQRLVEVESCDEIIRTPVFDAIQNSYSSTPWPYPFDSIGAVHNDFSRQWDLQPPENLIAAIHSSDSVVVQEYKDAVEHGNPDIGVVHAGQGVGLVKALQSTFDVIDAINAEALSILHGLPKMVLRHDR
ncbi:hypothetical protein FisN_6Lu142 [Fistulifera solaris]|uniref:Uncharacterized protein n=1 Tax=Fistulifera solaris TaxID=1519565 RepID=A0A1Z5J6B7_FISSO|nr:hypothetical protein FisN_6Lu142 [Fistulifera solaris]|eukprot:GAX09479.1 hypothetical protein FisN_6Lu142 [Fistulifera solaris]